MTDIPPLSFDAPPPPRSELEERAWALAERAQNYAHAQQPRIADWESIGPGGQASMMAQALTWICLQEAYTNPHAGTH